jgi:hypothetical protein
MKLAASAEPLDLPPNYNACYEFGTICPFYGRCFPTVTHRFKAMFNDDAPQGDDVGILEKLRANAGASTLPPLPGATTTTAVPVSDASATSTAAAKALDALNDAPKPMKTLLERLNEMETK